jgi:hypothetical protein
MWQTIFKNEGQADLGSIVQVCDATMTPIYTNAGHQKSR